MKELKVGDSFEVVEATKNGICGGDVIYKKGDFGICVRDCIRFIDVIIGERKTRNMGWYVHNSECKKVGKLTITKLKI